MKYEELININSFTSSVIDCVCVMISFLDACMWDLQFNIGGDEKPSNRFINIFIRDRLNKHTHTHDRRQLIMIRSSWHDGLLFLFASISIFSPRTRKAHQDTLRYNFFIFASILCNAFYSEFIKTQNSPSVID